MADNGEVGEKRRSGEWKEKKRKFSLKINYGQKSSGTKSKNQ
jgi:hypothetical protein